MSVNENNREGTSSEKNKANGDDVVTLGEVLRQQKELEDEYEQEYLEVLGGSDDKVCTYSQVKYPKKIQFLNHSIYVFRPTKRAIFV